MTSGTILDLCIANSTALKRFIRFGERVTDSLSVMMHNYRIKLFFKLFDFANNFRKNKV